MSADNIHVHWSNGSGLVKITQDDDTIIIVNTESIDKIIAHLTLCKTMLNERNAKRENKLRRAASNRVSTADDAGATS